MAVSSSLGEGRAPVGLEVVVNQRLRALKWHIHRDTQHVFTLGAVERENAVWDQTRNRLVELIVHTVDAARIFLRRFFRVYGEFRPERALFEELRRAPRRVPSHPP